MTGTNHHNRNPCKSRVAILVLLGVISSLAFALDPPTPRQIERYRKDGTLRQRIMDARAFKNHLAAPDLVQRMHYKTQSKMLELQGMPQNEIEKSLTPPAGWQGMPSVGDVKLFVLLLSFSDHDPIETNHGMESAVFGSGRSRQFPTESLRNYYLRSSYDQLDLQGSVLGWYRTPYPRSSVGENLGGREAVIKEALLFFDSQGHDFSQYDNDGDGDIDYFAVIWTGPHGEWAEFWWGYQTYFSDSGFLLDGKRFTKYSWQWESYDYPNGEFNPSTLIHETGHALGLPDYYDYDDAVGPRGGVGGSDMMDGSGDHNCFSKFLLDWIEPEYLLSDSAEFSLGRSSENPDALLIMHSKKGSIQPFEEYFMVQTRTRNGNDAPLPADGLLIWHVDARTDGWNYLYDNSYTDHKLLRLMEADGLEEIEKGLRVDSGDFYTVGSEFSNDTTPDSRRYNEDSSGVFVRNIETESSTFSFNAGVQELPLVEFTDLINGEWISGPIKAAANASHSEGVSSVEFWLDEYRLGVDDEAPYTLDFKNVQLITSGEHRLLVKATSTNNLSASEEICINLIRPGKNVIVVDMASDNESGKAIGQALTANGYNPIFLSSIQNIHENIASLAFICLGYSNNRYALTRDDSNHLVNFLQQGHALYVEGGETWAYDTHRKIQDWFGIVGLSDGLPGSLSTVHGVNETWSQGVTIEPQGFSDWVDWLDASGSAVGAYAIWKHADPAYICGVAREEDTYKTIGCSFEFANIPENQRRSVMEAYLDFFDPSQFVQEPISYPVPHIAGPDWQSSLTVINPTQNWTLLTVEKYQENGQLLKTNTLSLRPMSEHNVPSEDLGTDGIARLLAFGNDISVKLSFRYQDSTSLSDFFIEPGQKADQYLIPNTIKNWFDWFGIALANFEEQEASIELRAYKEGSLLSTAQIQVAPFSKYVGLSNQIWDGLQYQDVDMVLISSNQPISPPIAITGNHQQDRHVFFQGYEADNGSNEPGKVLIPHIAGINWETSLTGYNYLNQAVNMDLTTWDPEGTPMLYHHQIPPFSTLELSAGNDFEANGVGEVLSDASIPFKLSYQFGDSHSLAEFFVGHQVGKKWLIPNPRHDWFQWFGFAVANIHTQTTRVQLHAYRGGQKIATSFVELLPNSKIVQTSSDAWNLNYSEVDFLIVEADRELVFPVSITGTDEQDRHVFFVAQPLSGQ